MIPDQRATLSSYVTRLLSHGQVVFTRAQAQEALGISKGAVLDAAEKLQKRGHLISPRRGFYVIVPPQYLAWGAPPPSWYIDALMRHEGRAYYVGLLKAAELHGATHQAVMEFQVVTDKQLRRIRAGRAALAFYYRKDMDAVAAGIEDHKTDTGRMKISCVELTMLDLLRYPHAGGGLDHIVTVLSDLAERVDAKKLATLSGAFERSVAQRLGHLLCRLGYEESTNTFHDVVLQGPDLPWVELEPAQAGAAVRTLPPVERDERWRVTVRRVVEPDA
jgi:predicted transcriptional regulator of viral defense system